MGHPFISICIPAYKRLPYLKRLLDSIAEQRYSHYEVIISDDSDDDTVYNYLLSLINLSQIQYFKNSPSLGTPANWNAAISKAKGDWIKIMHDDDWFSTKDSLQKFVDATLQGPKFIYSAYSNFIETEDRYQPILHNSSQLDSILRQPLLLLSENIIGPPSVTLFHKSILEKYDERMKWRVDLEYYIRVLIKEKEVYYIQDKIINVGVSESQVTNYCINVPKVEIPEGYILLDKYGTTPLRNIIVFDAWWRILRNCQIRSEMDLIQFGDINWPSAILQIVSFQSKFSSTKLKNGFISKILMTLSYLQNTIQGKL
jgi:glycosyltransferase involved in cell wall biosynthesis